MFTDGVKFKLFPFGDRDAGQNAAADSAVDALAQTLERAVTVDDHPSDQNSDQVTTQERDSDTQNR